MNRGSHPRPFWPSRGPGLLREAPRRPLSQTGEGHGQISCREELELGWTESEEGEQGEGARCGTCMCKSLVVSKAHLRTTRFHGIKR